MKSTICLFFMVLIFQQVNSQSLKDSARPATDWKLLEQQRIARVKAKKTVLKLLDSFKSVSGSRYWIHDFDGDLPIYYALRNAISQATVSANRVKPGGISGFKLTGSGVRVGVWDDPVKISHVEFAGRITNVDGVAYVNDRNHGTHVAGTVAAAGVDAAAQGFANGALIRSYDQGNDLAEVSDAAASTAGADRIYVSNHSYGPDFGWVYNSTLGTLQWLAGTAYEDWRHGAYTTTTKQIDQLCLENPYYLMVRAAGNERGSGIASGNHIHNDATIQTDVHKIDGGTNGYECLPVDVCAKNALIVGNVSDIPAGYSGPASVVLVPSSCTGPTDDGRIKPDVVANGDGLYSPIGTTNTSYASYTGTSMAAPSVVGSIVLLQEQWNRYNVTPMYAHTMRALLIHTADEAGTSAGPDYTFGWGLINVDRAARFLHQAQGRGCTQIYQNAIVNQGDYTVNVYSNGTTPLKVTIAWNDAPPATVNSGFLNPSTSYLVNDLNLRVEKGAQFFYPWILNKNQPAAAATRGVNTADNVEQVIIDAPTAGNYTIHITAPPTVTDGLLRYALLVSGQSPLNVDAVYNNLAMNAVYTGINSVTVSGTSTVGTINPTELKAGNYIDIKPGFQSASGTYFKAYPTNQNGCFVQ